MLDDAGKLMDDLQQLWRDIDKLVGSARGTLDEASDELAGRVRDHAWAAVAVAAAAAFIVGVLLARRR